MAYTVVVTNSFSEAMISALKTLEREKGQITLAVMTPFSLVGQTDWSLYLAADWLDQMNLREGTRAMYAFFKGQLGPLAVRLQQVYVVRSGDFEVGLFAAEFDVPELGTAYRVIGLEADRFDENNAVLFVARQHTMADSRPQQTLTA